MRAIEKWIWLDEAQYPNNQSTKYSTFLSQEKGEFTVAEFVKSFHFAKKVKCARLRFSGHSVYERSCL